MKTYKKIDLYFLGQYVCSTNQSKTCRAAVAAYLKRLKGSTDRLGVTDTLILQRPHELKAFFDKN
jgi:hypothetical protein